jgi:pimeloyl-ACP methyl ester carboxylesterase
MSTPQPIFIHGSGGAPMVWGRQAGRMEGSVVLTLPGHGKNADPPRGSASAMADAVEEAVRAVAAPRVLVGHSIGGAVALELAIRPELSIEGLILINSGARLPVPDEVMRRVRDDFPAEVKRLVHATWHAPDAATVKRGIRMVSEAGSEALALAYEACSAFDARGWLAEITVPALVISGAEDVLTPPALSQELAEGLPNAEHVSIAAAAHMAMAESDDEVNLLIAGFLARREIDLAGE